MTTNSEELDKVRMTEEEEKQLNQCFDEDGTPAMLDLDSCYMCAAISIEEALYKLSNYDNYKVVGVREKFMGEPIISYYLVNTKDESERHWIVYSDHK